METKKETGIYYNDNHYSDIQALAEELNDNGELGEFSELGEYIEVEETDLEQLFQLDADWICDKLDEDRMSEDGDEVEDIRALIKKHEDNFKEINEKIPSLYYPNGRKYKISTKELLEAL